ncbi:TPA: hypothetical protein ACPKDB_000963 [Haemophilus influenzae]|uniref:hypothetical protein n=1 Tax=Haemophilus influenzae TaxID=727 RepID=UPI00049A7EC6|nr:hypothetical protein [Haemophilus influenzae]AIB45451.1 hypothetical protein H733_0630 [Haemophilus influenzae CGSHiCZ412602]MCK8790786.1 hypothetical protein [Haemophilus influenzae]MCK8923408.1 hypothetical protein [Haemophilus influenzae]MCK9024987.1 hypothetical protein [Haemophilus influenzae]UEB30809.1 hypothetical protein LK431_05355 [Haemophilus influenzae]
MFVNQQKVRSFFTALFTCYLILLNQMATQIAKNGQNDTRNWLNNHSFSLYPMLSL